jgi:ATP-dependent Lhr-like helicase
MALGIQQGGVALGDWWAWLEGATPFADLSAEERADVVRHMLDAQILADQGGRLWLGPEGERRYGRAGFRKLYAVFEAPWMITVRVDAYEVGTVDAQFLGTLDSGPEPGSFVLAGKPWRVVTIDWDRGVCLVRPEADGRAARWAGFPRHLSYELCQSMRRVLVDPEEDPSWSDRARRALATQRAEHAFLADEASPLVSVGNEITWWTFAGGAANVLLARMLETELGGRVIARNTSLTLQEDAGKSVARVREAISAWRAAARPNAEDALVHAPGAARYRISKFEACLPPGLLRELQASRLLDWEGAARVVRGAFYAESSA